ncbi:hypothetical protein LA080_013944 [Diaporthe eres]|nr:hypothetical protein LA080_013944 [Diaporthe eres]
MDVAGLVLALSQVACKTIALLVEVHEASSERTKLGQEVASLLSRTLEFKAALDASVYAGSDTWALGFSDQSIQELTRDLNNLCKKLEQTSKSRVKQVVSSVLWLTEKRDVARILDKVARVKQDIDLAISGNNLALAVKTSRRIEKTHVAVGHLQAAKQMSKSESSELHNLELENGYSTAQSSNLGCHHRELFCGVLEFQELAKQCSLEWLRQHFRSGLDVRVACAYCEYKEAATQNVQNLIMGLWRQLIEPSAEHSSLATKLWTDMDSEIVEAEMQKFSRVFFLVDALDEFPEASQQELISSLKSLQSKTHCNLMVTSRKLDSIAQIFDQDPEIQIDAQNDDLVTYIRARIQETPFQKVKQKYAAVEADVLKEVIPKCDKMFLLARLYMDSLSNQTRVSHFKKALKTLPVGLQTMYDDALNRIAADIPHTEDALKVLYWVSFAKRPLTVDELIHALAVTLEDKDYDADNELLDEITSICAGLLIIDPVSCVVRLAHHTTDEYLKKTQTTCFPGISSYMASVLLTYVSFDTFKTHTAVTRADAGNTLRQYPLLEYAATNWGHHFSESDDLGTEIRLRALEYLKPPHRFSDFLIKEIIEKEHGASLPGNINGTHIAVVFDLLEFIPTLQRSDPQQTKTESPMPSPLWTAAMFGKAKAVELLISGGAEVNGTSGYPVKALHRAAGTGGSLEICRLLIEHGADVNAPFATDPVYESDVTWIRLQTPLHEAAWHNNPKIAALLLAKGADMYAMTSDHETPWDFAVHCRSFATLDVLIEAFQGPGHWSKMIIQSLVRSGSTELINSMIQKGLDVNEISRHGKRALDLALDIGDESVINVLLENGAVSHYPWSQT